MTTLSAKRVSELFNECLKDAGQEVDGVLHKAVLDVAGHEDEITTMLAELPDEFHADKGGGWTFLNACMDRHGHHWAEHPTMEKLFMLGIAAGKARWQLPREMWKALPGGVPYVSVL